MSLSSSDRGTDSSLLNDNFPLDHVHTAREGDPASWLSAEMDSNAMLRFAVRQALQVVGEAAVNVSAATRAQAPDIEWAVIIGMRNRLVHAYFDINTDIVWATVTHSLPALLKQLSSIEGIDEPPIPGP